MTENLVGSYLQALQRISSRGEASDHAGASVALETAIRQMGGEMHATHERGNRIFFVGNGGSAAICSHLATDYSKNGGMRSSAMNDAPALTCLGNDFGYEHIFEKQLEWHARPKDTLVAISSSGRSQNILNAVKASRERDCTVYTFSGFDADNPLRLLGDLNIHLASHEYGFVEVGHLALLHSVLDIQMGWRPGQDLGAA